MKFVPAFYVLCYAFLDSWLLEGFGARHKNQQQKITSMQGDSVILKCELDFPGGSPVPYIVQWRKENIPIPVFITYKGYPPHHGKGYSNRVSLADVASLNLTNLQEADQGWYECKIVYLNRGTSDDENGTFVYLEVLAPPHFVDDPPDTSYVNLGEHVIIPCSAAGTPTPTIEWLKNGVRIYTRGNVKVSSKSLEIYNIQQGDIDQYTCIARNNEGKVSADSNIIIAGGAVITIPPHNITLLEGNKAEFICESKALPSNLTHRWYRNDMSIDELSWLSSRISLRQNDGTLIVNPTAADDSGKYTCKVTNGIGIQQSASAYLDVQYPARVTYNPSMQYLPLGLPGILKCFYESNPPILYVLWTKDDINVQPDSMTGLEILKNNGSLYFDRVTEEHQGRYTCTPFNVHGTNGVSNIMDVLVKAPPVYTVKPKDKYQVIVNKEVKMSCKGTGNPKPKIYWRRADGRSLSRDRVNIQDGRLHIKGLKKEDYGYYECVLTNEIATLVTSTLLIVERTTPHAPTNVSVNTSSSAATLTWLPAYDGGYKQMYRIWYKLADQGPNAWKHIRVPGNITVFTIHGLTHNTQYNFKVQSENYLGKGMSSPVVWASTKYSVYSTDMSGVYPSHFIPGALIPGRPRNVTVHSSEPNQVIVTWLPPINQSVPVSYYRIEHAANLKGPWKELEARISSPVTKFTVSDVEGGKKHYFRVTAHTNTYASVPSAAFEILVSDPPVVDKEKAITAGVVGGLLFFIVAIVLAICAVKVCNNRKRRKAEKAYMMVTCPVSVDLNGANVPSPVPLKNDIGRYLRPMLLVKNGRRRRGSNERNRAVEQQALDPSSSSQSIYYQNQPHLTFHDSFGHEQELEMLPSRRWRRFPKAVRYNVQMEYSQPPGWIRRTPDGRFVLSDDDDEDDGGFLAPPPPHDSVSSPYSNSLHTDSMYLNNSSQSFRRSDIPVVHSFIDPHFVSLSGNSSQSFGRGEIPLMYSPRDPRYRTSSPGFAHLNRFRPVFVEELSSVVQPSSVERTFPTNKLTPSFQRTPTGYMTYHGAAAYHTDTPTVRIIEDNRMPIGYSQQFRPIHRPIPRQRLSHVPEQHMSTHSRNNSIRSPFVNSIVYVPDVPYLPRSHLHIAQPHAYHAPHYPTLHHQIHAYPEQQAYMRTVRHPNNVIRVASAPLPSDMIEYPSYRHPHQNFYPRHNISRQRRFSPDSRSMPAQFRFSPRQFYRRERFSPVAIGLQDDTSQVGENMARKSHQNVKYKPRMPTPSNESEYAIDGEFANQRASPSTRIQPSVVRKLRHSPTLQYLPKKDVNDNIKQDRFSPVSVRAVPVIINDRMTPPNVANKWPYNRQKFASRMSPTGSQQRGTPITLKDRRISPAPQTSLRSTPVYRNTPPVRTATPVGIGPSPTELNFSRSSQRPFLNASPSRIARVPPSPAKHRSAENLAHTEPKTKRSPNGTLESTSASDNQPIEYTRERLQGAIERVRSGALSRASVDQPFRSSAPELSDTVLPTDTAADDIPSRSGSQAVARCGGALPSRCQSRSAADGDAIVNYDCFSITSGTSSGRGSKPASVSHSRCDSMQEDYNFTQEPSSSSGFASRNTSQFQSTMSQNRSNLQQSTSRFPFELTSSLTNDNHILESPQSEPSVLPSCGPFLNPLNVSVDENYEFDSVSPLDSEFLDKIKYCGSSRRGSNSSGERGVSDSELYTNVRNYPRPKRPSKYDNTEARCNALKQEFLRFRRRQEDIQQQRFYSGQQHHHNQLESAC